MAQCVIGLPVQYSSMHCDTGGPDSGVAGQTVRDVCQDLSEFAVKVLHCDWQPDPEDESTIVL